MTSVLALYLAYERLGFHIGAQGRFAKYGNGHKPGDYRFRPMGAVDVERMVSIPAKPRSQMTHDEVLADLQRLNVSVCATPPYCFLDLDGLPLEVASRTFGPNLWRHRTASGGWHVLVKVATDRLPIRNGAIETGNGCVDAKGMGTGYVIGPGSRTQKGEYRGWIGVIPELDDAALDTMLAICNGKLAEKSLPSVADVDAPKAPIGDAQIEGAAQAVRMGLAGEYPSSSLTGGKHNTYKKWTAMTWSINAYAGDPLYDLWESESVRFRRLPCLGTSTFAQTWAHTPASSTGAFFASVVNSNARARGVESPLPFYKPPRPPLSGVDISGVAVLTGV